MKILIRKYAPLACVVLLMICCLCACTSHSSKSYTWKVETGDQVKVELDTTESDYDIKPDGSNFIVSKGDQAILQGCFIYREAYDEYVQAAKTDEAATIIEETDNQLIYRYDDEDDSEYDCIVYINEKTCALVGSLADANVTEAIVRDALSRLTFTAEH